VRIFKAFSLRVLKLRLLISNEVKDHLVQTRLCFFVCLMDVAVNHIRTPMRNITSRN